MNSHLSRRSRVGANTLVLASSIALSAGWAGAQVIYVSDSMANTVSAYNLSGGPASTNPILYNLSNPDGLAVSGDDLYVANSGVNTIAEYNLTTMNEVGSGPLISGAGSDLSKPADIQFYNGDLYVVNFGNGDVNRYDPTTGALIGGAPLVTGLDYPSYLAISNGDLYVSTSNAVYAYNAATGAPLVSGALINNQYGSAGLAVNGNELYVADEGAGTVTLYNATTGVQIGSAPLISGLKDPTKIELYDGDLYVSDDGGANMITVYDATTGLPVLGSYPGSSCSGNFTIVGGDGVPVPEPSTWALLVAGLLLLGWRVRALAAARVGSA